MIKSKKASFDYEKNKIYVKDIALDSSKKMGTNSKPMSIFMIAVLVLDFIVFLLWTLFIRYIPIVLVSTAFVLTDVYYLIFTFHMNYKTKYHKKFDFIYFFIEFTLVALATLFLLQEPILSKSAYIYIAYKVPLLVIFLAIKAIIVKKKISVVNIIFSAIGGSVLLGSLALIINFSFIQNRVFEGYAVASYLLEDNNISVVGYYGGIGNKIKIEDSVYGILVSDVTADIFDSDKDVYLPSHKVSIEVNANNKTNKIIVPKDLINTYRQELYSKDSLKSVYKRVIPQCEEGYSYVILNYNHFDNYPTNVLPVVILKNGDIYDSSNLGYYLSAYSETNDLEYCYNNGNRHITLLSENIIDKPINESKIVDIDYEKVYRVNVENNYDLDIETWKGQYYFTQSSCNFRFDPPTESVAVSVFVGENEKINNSDELYNYVKLYDDTNVKVNLEVLGFSWYSYDFSKSVYTYEDEIKLNYDFRHIDSVDLSYKFNEIDLNANSKTHSLGVLSVSDSGLYKLEVTVTDKTYPVISKTFEFSIRLVITPYKIAYPMQILSSLTYNGKEQNPYGTINKRLTMIDGTYINAGQHNTTFVINDKENYTWPDGSTDDYVDTWTIEKALVNNPKEQTFTYDGEEHGFEETEYYTVTNGKKINAGSYQATLTLKDSVNYAWSSYRYSPETIGFYVINKVQVEIPNSQVFTYDGMLHGYEETEYYTVSNGKNINAGSYEATFTLNDSTNYEFTDSSAIKKVSYVINKAKVDIPNSQVFTYDGMSHGYEETEYYTVSNGKNINAGSYEATFSLNDSVNYEFTDTSAVKYVSYVINKAKVEISTPKTLVYNGNTQVAIEENEYYSVINGDALNAGDYKATIVLKDSNNYCFSDNTITSKEISFTILRKQIEKPTIEYVVFTYDGNTHSVATNGTGYYVSDGTNTEVGKYEATITLDSNYCWLDGSIDSYTISYEIVTE
ncbi:MAG: hypothetical protein ACI35W_06710 [Anaeroplasmataceae bacterium]